MEDQPESTSHRFNPLSTKAGAIATMAVLGFGVGEAGNVILSEPSGEHIS